MHWQCGLKRVAISSLQLCIKMVISPAASIYYVWAMWINYSHTTKYVQNKLCYIKLICCIWDLFELPVYASLHQILISIYASNVNYGNPYRWSIQWCLGISFQRSIRTLVSWSLNLLVTIRNSRIFTNCQSCHFDIPYSWLQDLPLNIHMFVCVWRERERERERVVHKVVNYYTMHGYLSGECPLTVSDLADKYLSYLRDIQYKYFYALPSVQVVHLPVS